MTKMNGRAKEDEGQVAKQPLVSIIIPVKNRWELTRECLVSIREHTKEHTYECIVVDGGSTDATNESIREQFSWVNYLRTETPLSFSEANNTGARRARGAYLLFLNNDTQVAENWLAPMVQQLQTDNSLAAVGPVLVSPDGTVQSAGVVFNFDKLGHNFGRGWEPDHPSLSEPNPFAALCGACLLCRKDLFVEAGMFSESYRNGYEDLDLCMKWCQSGFICKCVPASRVVHFESQSPGRHQFEQDNHSLFLSRWKHEIVSDEWRMHAQLRNRKEIQGIGVIHLCHGPVDREFLKSLHFLFDHSSCRLSYLIICPTRHLSSYTPWTTIDGFRVIDFEQTEAITTFIEACRCDENMGGILILNRPARLPEKWDRMLVDALDGSRALIPVTDSAPGSAGWSRSLLYLRSRGELSVPNSIERLPASELKRVFVIASCEDAPVCFIPRRMLAGFPRLPEHALSIPRDLGLPSVLVPSCLTSCGESPKISPALAVTLVALVKTPELECLLDELTALQPRQGIETLISVCTENESELPSLPMFPGPAYEILGHYGEVTYGYLANRAASMSISKYLAMTSGAISVPKLPILQLLHTMERSPGLALAGGAISRGPKGTCVRPLGTGSRGIAHPLGYWFIVRRSVFEAVGKMNESIHSDDCFDEFSERVKKGGQQTGTADLGNILIV